MIVGNALEPCDPQKITIVLNASPYHVLGRIAVHARTLSMIAMLSSGVN